MSAVGFHGQYTVCNCPSKTEESQLQDNNLHYRSLEEQFGFVLFELMGQPVTPLNIVVKAESHRLLRYVENGVEAPEPLDASTVSCMRKIPVRRVQTSISRFMIAATPAEAKEPPRSPPPSPPRDEVRLFSLLSV